jgi:hypothetical protein
MTETVEKVPRDICGVIRKIMPLVPELHQELKGISFAAAYTPPEHQRRFWIQACQLLSNKAPNREDIRAIIEGEK